MTEPSQFDLLELATPYALDAVSDAERAALDRQVAAAAGPISDSFNDEVRAIRETMAILSAATASDPPARLRAAVLAGAQAQNAPQLRLRTALLAAAAAIILGLTGFGAGIALRHPHTPTMTEQIASAPDMRKVSGQLAGGTATVTFSRAMNTGVLVMNGVRPPSLGTVYQMWLIDDKGPASAGTMDTAAVTPSTTHLLHGFGRAGMLAFTVEPGRGSATPTTPIIAKLPLG